jgi:hypothetical protein
LLDDVQLFARMWTYRHCGAECTRQGRDRAWREWQHLPGEI